jgi:hypothetical protein
MNVHPRGHALLPDLLFSAALQELWQRHFIALQAGWTVSKIDAIEDLQKLIAAFRCRSSQAATTNKTKRTKSKNAATSVAREDMCRQQRSVAL